MEADEQSEENDALYQLKDLHDGETLLLEQRELSLSETVYIYASDVLIRGASGGTEIECPPHGGALVIRCCDMPYLPESLEICCCAFRGTNVTLMNLTIKNCKSGSAVRIEEGTEINKYQKIQSATRRKILRGEYSKQEGNLFNCSWRRDQLRFAVQCRWNVVPLIQTTHREDLRCMRNKHDCRSSTRCFSQTRLKNTALSSQMMVHTYP